ncbi:leucine-rich_repeat domain-containing protein [Hexamita inflata]|uniref:Leucine-rich repeat domain-containing protein n=1 Tax=Hexamita inflata TaxID=28002 RepID=A0AA86Q6K9_9EUKA|nr:leucine-rich repeat domain-containing protein [Hexamita inflata]
MQPNQAIRSKEELINHFGASQKLEMSNLQKMKYFLKMDVQPEVWEDASKRNLLSFSQEFVQGTKEFTFNYGEIKNIYIISFLTNLTELNLQENQISDISAISKLKNLKKLYFGSNRIEDISALQHLPDLIHLYLSNNKLTFYTLTLPSLIKLSLYGNPLQDKSGLQHSPKLERLNLSGTETTDLHTIPPQLFGLKELDLFENNLTEISHLSNFIDLQFLDLGCNNQLQNIGHLQFCTQLTELNIIQTNVADIWPLQFMKNLKTLNMANTQVVDLHPLQNSYKLEQIYAYDACIMDVSPLSKLTKLDSLDFRNNQIINVDTTLTHHKNFSQYNFSNQKVSTADEIKFYNKILKVHSSHQQIRKIQNEKCVCKFRTSLASKKNYVSAMLNNQIMMMNKELNLFMQFIHNSNTYLD